MLFNDFVYIELIKLFSELLLECYLNVVFEDCICYGFCVCNS